MSVYVLDVPRFNKTKPPGKVRDERYVVFGSAGDGTAHFEAVYDCNGKYVDLGRWTTLERASLYDKILKADEDWRVLTKAIGRLGEAPGRVS